MAGSILGAAVKRAEDPRFVRGEGSFLANHHVAGALHMAAVRSPIAHGRIVGIDSSLAAVMPGVVGVYTAADLEVSPAPPGVGSIDRIFSRPALATDTVRFVGEVVAVVVAETAAQAEDAAGAVFADIDPLPVVVTPQRALAPDAPLLFPEAGSNVAYAEPAEPVSGMFDDADVVVRITIANQRVAAVPLEPNAAIAIPHDDRLEIRVGSQNVFAHRILLARAIGIDRTEVHALVPDLGGGFGAKVYTYPEQVLAAALARKLGVPVRWHETRRENLVGMTQGRAQTVDIEMGATRDGRVVGVRADVVQDVGAYPLFGAYLPVWTRTMACGPYAIPRAELGFRSVVTNTTPIHAYRGAGRPEATFFLERGMDLLAGELGLDPVELRRRNLIGADRFPYTTPTGAVYDSGDYAAALDEALRIAGYAELRTEQERRRRDGDPGQLGVGVCCYVEITAPEGSHEWAEVEVHDTGRATARVGTSGHGQGHETAFAQIVSGLTGIPQELITLEQGDTDRIARGAGTSGSRSLQIAGSGVYRATEEVVAKAKRIVAERLEAAVDDIVVTGDGRLGVAGVPGATMTWAEVATIASDPEGLAADEPGLAAQLVFDQGVATYPFGVHVSVVEVDTVTGSVRLVRHIAVDDCGTVLNPLLVAGQVHGGFAQGAGQALFEHVAHDQDGNPLTATLMSYLIPTAGSLPSVERGVTETPTPHNPLGAKGIGEAATIGATPAIHGAVMDALAPLGIRHIDMPLTSSRVWEAIRAATG